MDPSFFQSLNKDTAVLTVNRRLANQLQQEYAHYQQSLGKTVWLTPRILPLNTWLTQLWQQNQSHAQLLTDFQERCLWKKISNQAWSNISFIQQAWKNLALWNIPLTALKQQYNDTTDMFYHWAAQFQTVCKKQAWLTQAELPSRLSNIKKYSTTLPKQCLLLGFDDLPPAIIQFFEQVKQDCEMSMINPHTPTTDVHRISLESTETEIRTMAQWAKQEYKKNSKQKIACIVPNLSQIRTQVLRIFTETFSIETLLPGFKETQDYFNISAGQALIEFPLVQIAMSSLGLCQSEIKPELLSTMLQSPYLSCTDDDIDVGALADLKLRECSESQISLITLLPIFTRLHHHFPQSTWLKRWRDFIRACKDLPDKQTPSEWSPLFIKLFKTLGWPGYRRLNSIEHQVLMRWKKSLEEFSESDFILEQVDFQTALNTFRHQLSSTQFQPQGSDHPIQILGILEASGISFDKLWVIGLHDEAWPPTATPNPFIPYHLQIQHQMPHASASRELTFTKQIMKRLLSSAKKIILSSASRQGDKQLQASRLIKIYPEIKLNLSQDKEYAQIIFESSQTERIEDITAPTVTENEATRGGTWIFKQQAICPFSAFASIRLNAQSPQPFRIGISALDKGKLLHRILETLWAALKNQSTLLNLSENELNHTIETMVNKAIEEERSNSSSAAYQCFLALERDRLMTIVKEWLNIEKERTPFSVVEHESERHITIGSLSLNLQIDRIDKLEDGREIIIDYKTGLTNTTHWFTDRPTEPQLPIYCVYGKDKSSNDFSGIAYAQVRAGKMAFKGIKEEGDFESPAAGITSIAESKNIDGINNWETLLNHWKKTLEKLSDDFCQGNAAIDPLESACTYCELQSLCRIQDDG